MLRHLRFGTYIFFGALTSLGAAFIYFFVPETKNLSLEEMDILFGSVGVAAADAERMREIQREVGLHDMLRRSGSVGDEGDVVDEKEARIHNEEKAGSR